MGLIDYVGKVATAATVGFKAGYHGQCPQCGAIAEGEILFCAKCGTRLPNRHRCNSCGTFVKNSNFCPSCGRSVYAPDQSDQSEQPAKGEETQALKTKSNPQLERAFLLKQAKEELSKNKREKAYTILEKALEISPDDGEIYWERFVADDGYFFEKGNYFDIFYSDSSYLSEISNCLHYYEKTIFYNNLDYKNAITFGDESLKKKIQICIDTFLSNAMYCTNGDIKPFYYLVNLKNALPLFKEMVVLYDENKLQALSDQLDKYIESKTALIDHAPDKFLYSKNSDNYMKLTQYGIEIRGTNNYYDIGYTNEHKLLEVNKSIAYEQITSLEKHGSKICFYINDFDKKKYANDHIFQMESSRCITPDSIAVNKAILNKILSRLSLYTGSQFTNYKVLGGCYVATCVYGSYDCPEVWTLRRFRDDTLGSTWYGRAFIRTYYAISPTLVKWFGHTDWFKSMWRGTLDKMVNTLKTKGVEDTPYNDKVWQHE